MKLLYCKKCQDVISLHFHDKACACGESRGRYTDNPNAVYTGKHAVPFAIDNYSFFARVNKDTTHADRQWLYDAMHGKGKVHCWIMQKGNPNFESIKKLSLKAYLSLAVQGQSAVKSKRKSKQ